MSYCTPAEVRAAVNFPASGAPIEDDVIQAFIDESEEEIEEIYHTKFGNVETSGTAASGSTTTLVHTSAGWTANEWIGYIVWIYGGTGIGQYSEIQSNTTDTLTFNAVTTAPDATSTYRIVKLGYIDETVDGSGIDEQMVNYQPLVNLNALTIDETEVTPAYVYQYNDSGKLILGTQDVEVKYFSDTNPQLINMKYIYGVYPIPKIIKRLCICIAGIRTLTAQIAGTYDDFTSVSLPGGLNASKGEPYMNIQNSLNYLMGEAKGIVFGSGATTQVSGDLRLGASYRPFTLFA